MRNDLISGMERIFENHIHSPCSILIKGAAGSLKSALCFNLMASALEETENSGIYLTLEQDMDSHLVNMRSLGLNLPPGLMISDYTRMRKEIDADSIDDIDIMDSIVALLCKFKKDKGEGFTFFALDSINALYTLMGNCTELRLKMFHLVSRLRDLNLTAMLIKEVDFNQFEDTYASESFLSDGVIHLGLISSQQDVIRYVQVIKMRGVKHSLNKFQIDVGERGLKILGPAYI
jgi:KaiC/GvpD/RAD55 family RecA-like ATPase